MLCFKGAIGFNVALTSSQSTLGTIKFNHVKSNYGGGWKTLNKRFIAPCSGLYWFQLSIINGAKGKLAFAQLMHGNNILQKAWADSHDRFHLSTAAAVVWMVKGSYVEAQLKSGTTISNSNHWTNLVGHHIQVKHLNRQHLSLNHQTGIYIHSCALSTATIEYSCLSMCLSVYVSVCVSVDTITQNLMVQTT